MLSSILFFNSNGELIFIHKFLNDISSIVINNYMNHFINSHCSVSPITNINETYFLSVIEKNVNMVVITKSNANVCSIFDFLSCLPQLMFDVIEIKEFSEEEIQKSIPDILELLDHIVCCGYIHITDVETLRLLTQRQSKTSGIIMYENQIGDISWRPSNIVYKTNELIIDVIETISVTSDGNGNILFSELNGKVLIKDNLSGMPNVILELQGNEKITDIHSNSIELDNIVFNKCVKLSEFATDKIISFIPPDGEFELMKFRKSNNFFNPFLIIYSKNELPGNKFDIKINIKSTYDSKLVASPLVMTIPLPLSAYDVEVTSVLGRGKYFPEKNLVIWKVLQFQGRSQTEIIISTKYLSPVLQSFSSTKLTEPITVTFNISMLSSSGLTLKNLTLKEMNYSYEKTIKYSTQSGKYELRI